MLAELHISGLGVIDEATIEPAPGLTVVTGETGAGKTMIVTALGLVCGGRADSSRVRAGAKAAVVEVRLAPLGEDAHPPRGRDNGARAAHLATIAHAVGGNIDDDGSLVAVRSVSADGRSRAHVGGRSAPVAVLAELTEPLIAIHGQSDAMRLLSAARQRAVLDSFAGLDDEVTAFRALRQQYLEVCAEVSARQSQARDLAQREAVLRLGLAEVAGVDPQPAEDVKITAEIRRLDDADALRTAAATAMEALVGGDDDPGETVSAASLVHTALRHLESAPDEALTARIDDLRSSLAVLSDVGSELGGYIAGLDADPARLQTLLERQGLLRGLTRKYGEDIDAVRRWAADAHAELAALDTTDEAIDALRRRADELKGSLVTAAKSLSGKRREAARRLGDAATAELAHLAMGKASLRVAVAPLPEIGAHGADQVEILLTAHRGAPELPIARSASGGELSRIMLALEVVLAGADPVGCFVFDEVDAGVGGRAATEIGSRLAALARGHQVIVVTHLAQVAAFADRHYVVDADADGTVGASAVRALDADGVLTELARMLGGTDGATALAHAAELRNAALAANRRSPAPAVIP